jgi:voltage-gated potassium channel
MLARLLISFAYYLEESKKYKRVKTFFYNLLENPKSKIKPYFDLLIISLVILTVSILIYDVDHKIPYHMVVIENLAVSVFIFEWVGRFWVSANLRLRIIKYHEDLLQSGKKEKLSQILKIIIIQKLKYTFSPMSIIDLLAILPSYRPLRVLRIFLIFRLFKIFRYTKSINSFFKVLDDKKFEFNFLILLGAFAVFMSSTIMYVFEGGGENANIHSFLDTVYWAVITITTVGYGDITPVTLTGKIVTVFLVGGGFLILVLATSIVTNALSEKMDMVKEGKVLSQIGKIENLIVILGFGKMGQVLANELRKGHKKFIVIDLLEKNLEKAKELDYIYMKADVSNYETIKNIIFKNDVKKVVLTTDNDAVNLSILLTIKAERKAIGVVARANSYENIKKFYIAKADHVIFPYQTVAEVAVEYVGNSVKFDAIDNLLVQKGTIALDEIDIDEGSLYIGKTIEESGVDEFSITVIAILKNNDKENFIFNPNHQTYRFEANDSIVLIGEEKNIFKIKSDITRPLT